MRRIFGAVALAAAVACTKKQQAPSVQTALVARRDIIIDAQANGVVEPIAVIEVKSKASGVITKMLTTPGTDIAWLNFEDVEGWVTVYPGEGRVQ